MIYFELLVLREPIKVDYVTSSPPLLQSKKNGLCPALLRTSKKVYYEASEILYSENRFLFQAFSTDIAQFLHQTRRKASNIHHICIPLPTFGHFQPDRATLYNTYVENLKLIRNTCTNITTLELLVSPDCANEDPSNDLTKMIRSYGWTVKVTKLPRGKEISKSDGQVYRDLKIYWSHDKRTR